MNKLFLITCLLLIFKTEAYCQNHMAFTGTSNSLWRLFTRSNYAFWNELNPDNQKTVLEWGYEYTISSISGFSHLNKLKMALI